MQKGEHTLVFSDLPAEAVPGSIRVDGKATAGLDIQSVDTRRRYIPRADQEKLQAERKGIEDEIEKLRDDRGIIQGQEDAAQTQKTLLQNLAQMPGRAPAEDGQPAQMNPPPATDWTQILSLIASGWTEAHRSALDAEVKKRDLDRRIEELEKKLAALAPGRAEQTEVKVFVVAGATLDADMTVRYQVRNAGWTPRYDARLATGSKTAPPLLALTRRADIVQRTGETWENVAVQLSTTRPNANAEAPVIDTVTVDFEPEAKPMSESMPSPPPAPTAAYDGLTVRKKVAAGRTAQLSAATEPEAAEMDLNIGEQGASVAAAPFQAVFGVPGRLTVPATGEGKRVFLQDDRIEPVLTVRTVPKREAKAYLYAKLILPKGSPVLPGAGVAVPRRHLRRHRGAAGAVAGRGPRARLRRRRPGARAPCHRRREARRDGADLLGAHRQPQLPHHGEEHARAGRRARRPRPGSRLAERRHQGRAGGAGAADQEGHRRQARASSPSNPSWSRRRSASSSSATGSSGRGRRAITYR